MRYNPYDYKGAWGSPTDFKKGEEITSQYIDVQSKLNEKLFATFGARFDKHSQNLNEDSERISVAYLSDALGAKIKSSYGTGIKFPSLYEYYKSGNPDSLVAEHGESFDSKFFNFINELSPCWIEDSPMPPHDSIPIKSETPSGAI